MRLRPTTSKDAARHARDAKAVSCADGLALFVRGEVEQQQEQEGRRRQAQDLLTHSYHCYSIGLSRPK
eukprot:4617712-Pyramimonas_sp.AAC.1